MKQTCVALYSKGCELNYVIQGSVPEEFVFGAEGLGTVWMWAVEGFLSCVTQGVEPELLWWGEQSPTHQTLVPTCSPHLFSSFLPLSLFLPVSLSLSFCQGQRGGAPKQLGSSPSSLFLRRQCGNTVWGIGGSSCHGSPRVPLPWKFTCSSPASQAQLGKLQVRGCWKRRQHRSDHRKSQWATGNIEVNQNLGWDRTYKLWNQLPRSLWKHCTHFL